MPGTTFTSVHDLRIYFPDGNGDGRRFDYREKDGGWLDADTGASVARADGTDATRCALDFLKKTEAGYVKIGGAEYRTCTMTFSTRDRTFTLERGERADRENGVPRHVGEGLKAVLIRMSERYPTGDVPEQAVTV